MACKDGRCGITPNLNPQFRRSNVSTGSTGNVAKSYKGTLYYPTLDIQLITNAGIPVQGHIQMRTGLWGILSSAEGDTTRLLDPIPSADIGKFGAAMRRGLVTIDITKAECAKGFFLINKRVRKIHLTKEAILIKWDASEVRYD